MKRTVKEKVGGQKRIYTNARASLYRSRKKVYLPKRKWGKTWRVQD